MKQIKTPYLCKHFNNPKCPKKNKEFMKIFIRELIDEDKQPNKTVENMIINYYCTPCGSFDKK